MTMPAGLPPPRPDQGFAPAGSPMAPGSQNVVRARQIIVFGPSGSIVGFFEYAVGTTPGPGNPPVVSITRSATDPFGNAVQPDMVAYGPSGSFVEVTQGLISFKGTAAQSTPAQIQTGGIAGLLDLTSGQATIGDPAAEITLESAAASGAGHEQILMNATEIVCNAIQITATTTTIQIQNGAINLSMAVPTNYPLNTSTATTAQIAACLNALITSMINRALIA